MAGAAIRRGKLKGQKEAARLTRAKMAAEREARREEDKIYEEEQEKVAAIMKLYDKDQSGFLEASELPKLLMDYSLDRLGRTGNPTEDHVQCLIFLADDAGNGKLDKSELIGALWTWFAYMQHEEKMYGFIEKFDLSKEGTIRPEELKPLLQELNKGEEVPDEVLKWVFGEADVTQNGQLNSFELARAIAVWYSWTPDKETEAASMAELRRKVDDAQAPPPPEKNKKSSFCVVL